MKSQVEEQFTVAGLMERIGPGHIFPTVDEAVAWCDANRKEEAP
jgi:hypothetical protein